MWVRAKEELVRAVMDLGFPEELGKEIVKNLGSPKAMQRMIWQIGKLLSVVRQESQLAILSPFVNYSLVNAMLEPIGLGNTSVLIPDYKPEQFAQYAKKYKLHI